MTICKKCRCGFDGLAGDHLAELCNRCAIYAGFEASTRLLTWQPYSGIGPPAALALTPPNRAHAESVNRLAEANLYSPGMYQSLDPKTGKIYAVGGCGFGMEMKPEHSGCLPDIRLLSMGLCL